MAPLAEALGQRGVPAGMSICLHQTTTAAAGYRKSLEGYARAGIKFVEVIPPLVVVFMSLALGIAQLPKSSALIVSVTVGVAAMAWCLLVSQWWRQWVGTLNGVDHVAVERLARRTGLIWGRL